jgi:putative DNA primase/helicase
MNRLDVTGKWYGVLTALGIDREYLQNKHGPCPICNEGKDRFRFDDKDGRGTYFCNTCGAGDGFELLQRVHGWSFVDCLNAIRPILDHTTIQPNKTKKDPVPALRKVAQMSSQINYNGEVANYLKKRGLKNYPDTLKEAMLYSWEHGVKIGPFPSMLGLIQDSKGVGVSWHITYTHNGDKLKGCTTRKIMTPKGTITGAAIRLHEHAGSICIAEGIETAIAASIISELPAFSTMNAHCMATFEPPEDIERVAIYADNDLTYVGQKSAYQLAERLAAKRIDVEVLISPVPGEDWLDELNRKQLNNEVNNETNN